MPNYFYFNQNNPGGSFDYDPNTGISVNVYIEADDQYHAIQRAEDIGIYFYDSRDCGFYSPRWSEVDSYDIVDDSEIPEKDEALIRDDNKEDSYTRYKWMNNDQYETFVHPLDAPFYGAHKEFKRIRKPVVGFGMQMSLTHTSDIFKVTDDGWDKTGNRSAPAPMYAYSNGFIVDKPNLRVTRHVNPSTGNPFYTLWSSDEKVLKNIAKTLVPCHEEVEAATKAADLKIQSVLGLDTSTSTD